MADESIYNEWIAKRRAVESSPELTDRIMAALEQRDVQPNRYVRLADRMNESRPARWAACMAAFGVGSLPFFLLVAYVAHLFVF